MDRFGRPSDVPEFVFVRRVSPHHLQFWSNGILFLLVPSATGGGTFGAENQASCSTAKTASCSPRLPSIASLSCHLLDQQEFLPQLCRQPLPIGSHTSGTELPIDLCMHLDVLLKYVGYSNAALYSLENHAHTQLASSPRRPHGQSTSSWAYHFVGAFSTGAIV